MKYLSARGERIPALGFGTWQLKGKECREAVKDALEIGYRHIDTAQVYGNEQQVGRAIRESEVEREDIWLTTKLWKDSVGSGMRDSFRSSIDSLETDYVDLLLIHWPFEGMDLDGTLERMAALVDDGKVRNIGVSNFEPEKLEEALELSPVPLLTNQVEYHPLLNQDPLLEKCRENDMMLTAYSPLAKGSVIGNKTLKDIGKKHGKTEAQVALRWLIQQDKVSAIPKAASSQHRHQNLEIFDYELSESEMERIQNLTSRNERQIDI